MIAAPALPDVKLSLRLDEDHSDSLLTRQIGAATALANRQAQDAPQDIAHEAIIRCVAYLYQGAIGSGEIPQAGIWRRCGAQGLLSPWTIRRAGKIEKGEG